MWPSRGGFDALDFEFEPVPFLQVMDASVEVQQELESIVSVSAFHIISRDDIIKLYASRQPTPPILLTPASASSAISSLLAGPRKRRDVTTAHTVVSLPGCLIMAAPQPAAYPLAADGPGFPIALDSEIGEGGAGGVVKQGNERGGGSK